MASRVPCLFCSRWGCDGSCIHDLDAYFDALDNLPPRPLLVDWDGDDRDDFERMYPPNTTRRADAERW